MCVGVIVRNQTKKSWVWRTSKGPKLQFLSYVDTSSHPTLQLYPLSEYAPSFLAHNSSFSSPPPSSHVLPTCHVCFLDAEYEYFEQRQLPARPVQPGLQPLLQVSPDPWHPWLRCWCTDGWVALFKAQLSRFPAQYNKNRSPSMDVWLLSKLFDDVKEQQSSWLKMCE